MTERGLPIVDGAPACPFVAFDEDRDGRALAPDHRHRCYAEARPAPRALAHQEAYCLSSAFPVCPTFQDWARREAAAARPPQGGARDERPTPAPVSQPMPPLDRAGRHAPGEPEDASAHRNPQRDWAAPPPWSADAPGPGDDAFEVGIGEPEQDWGRERREVRPGRAMSDDRAGRDAGMAGTGREGRGLAGSTADRWAGGAADDAWTRRTTQPADPDPTDEAPDDDPEWAEDRADDEDAGDAWVTAPGRATAPAAPTYRSSTPQPYRGPVERGGRRQAGGRGDAHQDRDGRDAGRDGGRRDQVRRQDDPEELFGPAWERPRRYEAYPSLRTRMGLPSLPRPLLAGIALVLAAVALFLFGPMLLGLGGGDNDPDASPTPSVAASPTPAPSVAPTPTPAPTPQVYVIAAGDTLSKIAANFGLTLEELLAANPQITNPNAISIGQEITIPVAPPDEVTNELPTEVTGSSAPSP